MALTEIQKNAINMGLKTAKVFMNGDKQRSIARLAKDSIIQYPVIISNSIENKYKVEIVKGLERQMASLLVIFISSNNRINMNHYQNISDFIKSFHNNSAIPYNFDYANDLINIIKESFIEEEVGTLVLESLNFIIQSCDKNISLEKDAVLECWNSIYNEINNNKLNDLYKPFNKTAKAMENAIMTIESFFDKTELFNDFNDSLNNNATYSNFDKLNNMNKGNSNKIISENERVLIEYDAIGKMTSKKVQNIRDTKKEFDKLPSNYSSINDMARIVENRDLSLMAPTLVQCEFLLTNDSNKNLFGDGSSNKMSFRASFGVKAMARSISSNIIVSNIIAGLSNSAIFKFIKWTKGELKFVRDIIFGISEIKYDAKINKTAARVFANLRSLKRKNAIGKITGRNVPATTVIIITEYEAEQIKEHSGIDLRVNIEAIKYIKRQFLLGFGIFNNETEVLSIMFDSDEEFHDITISTLKSTNRQDTTMNNIAEALKTMARYN